MTGRMLNERLGKWNFWTMFIGFNVAFFPMHIAGLMGMPRRIYTYSDYLGLDTVNLITSIGAFVFAIGVVLFAINVLRSLRNGERAGNNPWDAPTLEWSVSSPPPPYNFLTIPIVASRHPLWEDRLPENENGGRSQLHSDVVLDEGRETIATSVLDADPDAVLKMPDDSMLPFWFALILAVLFFALLGHLWWLALLACAGSIASTVIWLQPRTAGAGAKLRGDENAG